MSRLDTITVFVEISGATVPAGIARFTRGRGRLSTTFAYDPLYLANPDAYELDPALRLVTGNQHVRGLPGVFTDTAPDRWGRNLLDKRERELAREQSRRPNELDDVDYLLGVADSTRQGTLRFSEPGSDTFLGPASDVPKLISLPHLLHAADAVVEDVGGMRAIAALLDAGTGSLGGARPKASIVGDDNWLAIAKFPHHHDEWNVMGWEATALDIAAAAGIRAPSRRLVTVADRQVLVLRRFDRESQGGRIGYISALSMLGLRDGDQGDYADIAEVISRTAATVKQELHELFARVTLSVALHNTDDHLRNHGFLHTARGWVLSPAFDFNPNPSPASSRQCSIAGAVSVDDEIDGLLALAVDCRLSNAEAGKIIATVADAAERWRELSARNGITAREQTLFSAVLDERIAALRKKTG